MKHPVRNRKRQQTWLNSQGEPHRLNGPAITTPNGTKCWYVNGRLHRVNGPAVEYAGGRKEDWLDGRACNVIERSAPNPFAWFGSLLCGLLEGAFECLVQIR